MRLKNSARSSTQDIENPESELYVNKPEDRLATLEDRDEYVAANIFWVPKEARWQHLLANAKQPTIGKTLDDAMIAIERDNPSLKGVSAERLRAAGARQATAGRSDRFDWQHRTR